MKSSIYISVEQIQVIGHERGTVRQYATYPLPEGTMYNGTITDYGFLTECLASMRKQYAELFKGGVSLIIDGGSILTRRLQTPKLSPKQYLQLVRDDFADSIASPDDRVCAYRKLEGDENAILACAINKNQLDGYTSAFEQAGIKLESIHIGVETIFDFVKSRPDIRKSTVVLNIIDGFTMLSMLFDNGRNVFMSRTRLQGDEKEQVFRNILENLNGLIQFTRSQKFEDIARSYYIGINDADMRLLEALNPYRDIELGALSVYGEKGVLPAEAHFASLNMLYGDRDMNFLAARRELDKIVKRQKPRKLWIPVFAAIAVLLAVPSVYMLMEGNRYNRQIAEINDFLNNPMMAQKEEELEALSGEMQRYRTVERQWSEKTAQEDARAKATSDMLERVVMRHGVSVQVTSFEFNESSGVARVSARCADANVVADYVDALLADGVAGSVDYKGYGSGNDGQFTFTVEATININGGLSDGIE